ncbi:hypothetical protein M431DRAFT_212714 [Trichoderma harzianum CBS 226.95]|uniref:Uncharacterized protein n=1 Tax=Trichoderma harzianum CBS 226.95 TaxID=983964 RepID=A0A2T4A562_TRIHA|nr:hypothetical protein M431DRAFT_212714 [Trichoderma harzianum CBS 226.95]PTB52207.1 hypothetical protein M431DRAFT_212714 [Trichoderma harzianum CBS 226.95]
MTRCTCPYSAFALLYSDVTKAKRFKRPIVIAPLTLALATLYCQHDIRYTGPAKGPGVGNDAAWLKNGVRKRVDYMCRSC